MTTTNKKVTKKQLIDELGKRTGFSKAQSAKFLAVFQDAITDYLKKGYEVNLIGFLSFVIAKRAARNGRNPKTGAKVRIPETKTVKTKAGKTLKAAVK